MRIRSCIRTFSLGPRCAPCSERPPRDETAEAAARDVSVLQANFRNTRAVTVLANRLLKIKQARFGSVDRESNFLVKCASHAAGEVRLLKAEEKALKALDASCHARQSAARGDCFAR